MSGSPPTGPCRGSLIACGPFHFARHSVSRYPDALVRAQGSHSPFGPRGSTVSGTHFAAIAARPFGDTYRNGAGGATLLRSVSGNNRDSATTDLLLRCLHTGLLRLVGRNHAPLPRQPGV
jgi:hypothetical protein